MRDNWHPKAPYDFSSVLQRYASRPSRRLVVDAKAGILTRTLQLGDRVVPLTITSKGTVDSPWIEVTYPDWAASHHIRIAVDRILGLDIDLSQFETHMAKDRVWHPLLERFRGVRPMQEGDLFETMVKVIIGQQLNVTFAATLVDRLIDYGGHFVQWEGQTLWVFPSAREVAGWTPDDLRQLSFSQRKAEYVIDWARSVMDGTVDLAQLWDMSDDQVTNQLMPLRGVGQWTVECFLLFGLGRLDVFPAPDIGVQRAMQRLYQWPVRPNIDIIRQTAQAWSPWRSLATYYLWQSLLAAPVL